MLYTGGMHEDWTLHYVINYSRFSNYDRLYIYLQEKKAAFTGDDAIPVISGLIRTGRDESSDTTDETIQLPPSLNGESFIGDTDLARERLTSRALQQLQDKSKPKRVGERNVQF